MVDRYRSTVVCGSRDSYHSSDKKETGQTQYYYLIKFSFHLFYHPFLLIREEGKVVNREIVTGAGLTVQTDTLDSKSFSEIK